MAGGGQPADGDERFAVLAALAPVRRAVDADCSLLELTVRLGVARGETGLDQEP